MQINPQFLSKESFYKSYPQLHYGWTEKWFVVQTEDQKICGLALSSFPNPSSLLRLFKRHVLIENDVYVPHLPAFLLAGTPFQQRVWNALLEIPCGVVESYQDLANRLHLPKAVRAVANAVGANPISPLIPCHRVIASRGHIGGYHWGLAAKTALLREEGFDFSYLKGLPMNLEKEYRERAF